MSHDERGPVRDRAIGFSAPMVRALLDGRKTMTRRVLKPQPYSFPHPDDGHRCWNASGVVGGRIAISDAHLAELHRYAPGDWLWCREAFSGPHEYDVEKWPPGAWFTGDPIWYWADGNPTDGDWTKPKPSIHMPRWASRLTLLVSEVRVQRLQDISAADTIAEGVQCSTCEAMARSACHGRGCFDSRILFHDLWDSLHGPNAWSANPWVVALTFQTVRANINAIQPESVS